MHATDVRVRVDVSVIKRALSVRDRYGPEVV